MEYNPLISGIVSDQFRRSLIGEHGRCLSRKRSVTIPKLYKISYITTKSNTNPSPLFYEQISTPDVNIIRLLNRSRRFSDIDIL